MNNNRNTAPSSLYMQDVNVPSIMEGDVPLEVPVKKLETFKYQDMLLDMEIDADSYVIGPGDVMGLYLWGDLDREYMYVVTPEGLFIIPKVGEIKVSGQTLSQVKDMITEKVHTKYQDIKVSVFIIRPRAFKIFISGLVVNAGLTGTNSMERVSEVINRAGLRDIKNAAKLEDDRQIVRKGSSQRSIIVYRDDETIEVDLLRYRKMGELEWNPYVRMGDRIHVPQYIGDSILIGEVHNSGRYEFKPGDTVSDLIDYGGGLTVLSDTTNAILTRFEPDGKASVDRIIDLYDAIIHNPDDPKYLLQESDRLYVYQKHEFKSLTYARVYGQVKYPGEYPINQDKTTLSDLITMAGGLTEFANLAEAEFIRRMPGVAADQEYNRLRQMSRYELTEEEYDYLKSRSRMTRGKISLDFVKLFNDHDLSGDLTLQHGDNVFVPFLRGFVQVSGAVVEPGNLKFVHGSDYKYYIGLTGGYMWNSNPRKIRIIKGKTGQRFKPKDIKELEAGDIIHIPEKTELEKWQFFRETVFLCANIATIFILAQKISE